MYLLRYTPQAMRDMDSVWDEVYQASKSYDIADKYIKDFIDTITKKKQFPTSGIPLRYKGLFTRKGIICKHCLGIIRVTAISG